MDGEIVRSGSALVAGGLPADSHPVAVYLARLSPGSRRAQAGALQTIAWVLTDGAAGARECAWHELDYQHVQAVRSWLAQRYAPATCNRMLAALRGVLGEAWRLGLIPGDRYRRLVDVRSVRGSSVPRGRALSQPELGRLFGACGGDAAGVRDSALLAVLYAGGLRRAEAAALDVADFVPAEGSLLVRSGKGGKSRITYVSAEAVARVTTWVAWQGEASGPLFVRIRARGRVTHERLTPQGVRRVLVSRCELAGVAHVSPHDLRRSMISDLLDAGADISTVQRLAGHSQVTTTQRYDRRGEGVKRRAAGLLRVPSA